MKRYLLPLSMLAAVCALYAQAELSQSDVLLLQDKKEALKASNASYHEAKIAFTQQLELANPEDREALLQQWREDRAQMREQQQGLKEAISTLAGTPARAQWQRPTVPQELPADTREAMELRYDIREAKIALAQQLANAESEQHKDIVEAYRVQISTKRERLEEIHSARNSTTADVRFAVRPTPQGISAEEQARLEARNERIERINQFKEAIENASSEERSVIVETFIEDRRQARGQSSTSTVTTP